MSCEMKICHAIIVQVVCVTVFMMLQTSYYSNWLAREGSSSCHELGESVVAEKFEA